VRAGRIFLALSFAAAALLSLTDAFAQSVEPPNKRFLFSEDRLERKKVSKKKKEIQAKQSQIVKRAREQGFPYDLNATTVEYDSAGRKIRGSGGVIIGYASSILEAEEGEISLDDKVADLRGDVRVSDVAGTLAADEMHFKLDDGTGVLKNAELFFEDGHYRVLGKEIRKVGPDDYEIEQCTLTTCECAESDSTDPWRLEGQSGEITRNGYGQIYNTLLYAYNVPVFYTPYSLFPVKTERQSGLIPGSFGGGGRAGPSLVLPLYLVLDRTSDATVSMVYSSKARTGVDIEYRKIFSDSAGLEMGGLYFDESRRDGDLFGTNISGLADPTIDRNRYGGYLTFDSLDHKLFGQQLQFIARGGYVSDDLILREYQNNKIAPFNSRFVTSRATARYNFLDTFTFDAAVEYNQDMVQPDYDLLHRVPDLSMQGLHVFRPFGDNPLGARVVVTDNLTATTFARDHTFTADDGRKYKLFDGSRAGIYEQIAVPMHYKNYFDFTVAGDIRADQYAMNNDAEIVRSPTTQQNTARILPSSSNRVLPGFTMNVGSTLDKVYQISDLNPLKYIAELGSQGRQGELVRMKHTLEPDVRYRYVPQVDQEDNPQFDSTDRLPRRNLVTYSLTQRFYGKFEGRDPNVYGIEETTPLPSDLGVLSSKTPIDQAFDLGSTSLSDAYGSASTGMRRELFNLIVAQTYDIDADRRRAELEAQTGVETRPFSDFTTRASIIPNEYFRFAGGFAISPYTNELDAYDIGSQLMDKRGDQFRGRLVFTNGSAGPIRQFETSTELRVTDRIKLGFYGRYDDVKKDFLERKIGLRFNSSCRCWILDVDVVDRLNPNDTSIYFTLTLKGIAELGTSVFRQNRGSVATQ